ncbi:hypothetical protein [Trichodesmium erythraeum]|uniref:hypothetical protein n=1 Tax=Trichodesmium erythraeum TaxID=1206 RepID=UPI0012DFA64A
MLSTRSTSSPTSSTNKIFPHQSGKKFEPIIPANTDKFPPSSRPLPFPSVIVSAIFLGACQLIAFSWQNDN